MSDTTFEAAAAARKLDLARLRSNGALHFALVMAALTLWGAADAWAVASGWGLAQAVALANALIAGTVIASTLHEWGHLAGARLSGAVSPLREKPVSYYFIFDFSFEENDRRQFLWMSWGGILVPWLLVFATPLLIPIDDASRALLLAVFAGKAVEVSVFEVPVALRTRSGGDPREELGEQLKRGFAASHWAAFAVGAAVFLLA